MLKSSSSNLTTCDVSKIPYAPSGILGLPNVSSGKALPPPIPNFSANSALRSGLWVFASAMTCTDSPQAISAPPHSAIALTKIRAGVIFPTHVEIFTSSRQNGICPVKSTRASEVSQVRPIFAVSNAASPTDAAYSAKHS